MNAQTLARRERHQSTWDHLFAGRIQQLTRPGPLGGAPDPITPAVVEEAAFCADEAIRMLEEVE